MAQAQDRAPTGTIALTSGITALVAVDRSNVAAGLADGRVIIWNGADDAPSLTLSPHKGRVLAVGAAPDGRHVLSLSADGTMAETPTAKGVGGRTLRVDLGTAPTRAANFSADGTRLVTGGEFGDLRVFDVESGRLRHTLRGHRTEIQDLAFRPQSTTVASAGADADIRVWDSGTGRQTGIADTDLSSFAVAFSPRDGMLASGGPDRRVTLRDPGALKATVLLTLPAPKMVGVLAWSPDGRLLAVGDIDDETLAKGGLQIIDTSSRGVIATLATGGRPPSPVVFFAGGERLAAVVGRELRAWTIGAAG
jgi:WD40 repeat protein